MAAGPTSRTSSKLSPPTAAVPAGSPRPRPECLQRSVVARWAADRLRRGARHVSHPSDRRHAAPDRRGASSVGQLAVLGLIEADASSGGGQCLRQRRASSRLPHRTDKQRSAYSGAPSGRRAVVDGVTRRHRRLRRRAADRVRSALVIATTPCPIRSPDRHPWVSADRSHLHVPAGKLSTAALRSVRLAAQG